MIFGRASSWKVRQSGHCHTALSWKYVAKWPECRTFLHKIRYGTYAPARMSKYRRHGLHLRPCPSSRAMHTYIPSNGSYANKFFRKCPHWVIGAMIEGYWSPPSCNKYSKFCDFILDTYPRPYPHEFYFTTSIFPFILRKTTFYVRRSPKQQWKCVLLGCNDVILFWFWV